MLLQKKFNPNGPAFHEFFWCVYKFPPIDLLIHESLRLIWPINLVQLDSYSLKICCMLKLEMICMNAN